MFRPAAKPKPATAPSTAKPKPATKPGAAKPKPATKPGAAKPKPATKPGAAKPKPAAAPAAKPGAKPKPGAASPVPRRLLRVTRDVAKLDVVESKISWQSLTDNDSFVMDVGSTVFVWNGMHTGKNKKAKAQAIAERINAEELKGQGKIVVIGIKSLLRPLCNVFHFF